MSRKKTIWEQYQNREEKRGQKLVTEEATFNKNNVKGIMADRVTFDDVSGFTEEYWNSIARLYKPKNDKPGWEKVDMAFTSTESKSVADKFWKMEERYSSVPKGDLDPDRAFIISLGYSVPGHWPVTIQTACKKWFSMYGEHLSRDSEGEWWRRSYIGGMSIKLTFEDVAGCILSNYPDNPLQDNKKDSDWLAGQIFRALNNRTKFGDEYRKEAVMTRTLYEVYVVNIEDVEDVVVDQVVADSTDKAKMRAWAAMVTPEIGDVDKYDFFTKEIGPVREAKCGSTCDRG